MKLHLFGYCHWGLNRPWLCRQGWDVLLRRMRECQAALQAPDMPAAEADTSQLSSAPGRVALDAQSGLLVLEVVATSHRGERALPAISALPNSTRVLQMLSSWY